MATNAPMLYHYDDNGFHLNVEDSFAMISPLDGEAIIPNNATLKQPNAVSENEANKFVEGEWVVVPDYRNSKLWDKLTGKEKAISGAGKLPEEEQLTQVAPKYSHSVFDEDTNEWIADYEKYIEIAIELIHAEKRRARDSGIEINGILWDTDETARSFYIGAFLEAAVSEFETIHDFKASDGVWIELDRETLISVYSAVKSHVSSVYSWVRSQEEFIMNCRDVELLQKYIPAYNAAS